MKNLGFVTTRNALYTHRGIGLRTVSIDLHEVIEAVFGRVAFREKSPEANDIYAATAVNGMIQYQVLKYAEQVDSVAPFAPVEAVYAVTAGAKQSMKVGKFLKIIGIDANQKQIDKFIGLISTDVEFEIVGNDEIARYYLGDMYEEHAGTLSKSCMRYPECQPLIMAYEKFDVQLAIIKRKNSDYIIGRTLLWTVENASTGEIEFVYDRIYSPSILVEKFEELLKAAGYSKLRDTRHHYIAKSIKPFGADELLPYIDTMCFVDYSEETGTLWLHNAELSESHMAQDVNGTPALNRDKCEYCGEHHDLTWVNDTRLCHSCLETEYRYSNYHDEYINESDAYLCECCDDYFYYSEVNENGLCEYCEANQEDEE